MSVSGTISGPLTVVPVASGQGIANVAATVAGASVALDLRPDVSLAPGTYPGTLGVQVCEDAACTRPLVGSPVQLPYSVVITPGLTAAPATIALTYVSGAPASTAVAVQLLDGLTDFTATVGTDTPWLTIADKTPQGFTLVSASIPAGTHATTVTLAGGGTTLEVPVNVTVAPPAGGERPLSAAAATVTVAAQTADGTSSQFLGVTPPSWNPPLQAQVSFQGSDAAWVTATPAAGGYVLQFDPSLLGPGVHTATLLITGDSFTQPVGVVVTITVQDYAVALGPMIGATTPQSGAVWLRLNGPSQVRVTYVADGSSGSISTTRTTTSIDSDFTATLPLTGLAPATGYSYQVVTTQGDGSERTSPAYHFRTTSAAPASLSFVVMGDFALGDRPSAALGAATSARPDFLAVIGDFDHRGPALIPGSGGVLWGPQDTATVLEQMRGMRRDMRDPTTPLGADIVEAITTAPDSAHPQVPFYDVWDDHDFCANNSDATCPFSAQALQAWSEYFVPADDNGLNGASGCGQSGVWQSVPFGTLATVFMLDSRANRDEANGTTMLGTCQKAWLLAGLKKSTATWKVILTPVTFNPGTKTSDAWGHFPAERAEILDYIGANGIRNVLVVSADIHSGGAIDDGTHAGLPEISIPHANMPANWVNTYCHIEPSPLNPDVNILTSEPGTWTIGGLVDPNIGSLPHTCLGVDYGNMRTNTPPPPPYPLTGTSNPGYARIDLTPTSASLRVMNASGLPQSGFLADGTRVPLGLSLTPR